MVYWRQIRQCSLRNPITMAFPQSSFGWPQSTRTNSGNSLSMRGDAGRLAQWSPPTTQGRFELLGRRSRSASGPLDPDCLDVHELTNAGDSELPAVARALHSTERHVRNGNNHAIYEDHAGFDL